MNLLVGIKAGNSNSKLWKNVDTMWPEVKSQIMFSLGNSHLAHFWTDAWLKGDDKLAMKSLGPITHHIFSNPTADYSLPNNHWNIQPLQSLLS